MNRESPVCVTSPSRTEASNTSRRASQAAGSPPPRGATPHLASMPMMLLGFFSHAFFSLTLLAKPTELHRFGVFSASLAFCSNQV